MTRHAVPGSIFYLNKEETVPLEFAGCHHETGTVITEMTSEFNGNSPGVNAIPSKKCTRVSSDYANCIKLRRSVSSRLTSVLYKKMISCDLDGPSVMHPSGQLSLIFSTREISMHFWRDEKQGPLYSDM